MGWTCSKIKMEVCSERSAVAGSVKTVMDFIAIKKGDTIMTSFSKASLCFYLVVSYISSALRPSSTNDNNEADFNLYSLGVKGRFSGFASHLKLWRAVAQAGSLIPYVGNFTKEKSLVRIWKCVENAVKDSYLSKYAVTQSIASRWWSPIFGDKIVWWRQLSLFHQAICVVCIRGAVCLGVSLSECFTKRISVVVTPALGTDCWVLVHALL
jgi:hypothetical protein